MQHRRQLAISPSKSKLKQEQSTKMKKQNRPSPTFEGSNLFYDENTRFQIISGEPNHQKFEYLLTLMYILENSMPNMKINQIYDYVFSSNNEKLVIFYKGQLLGGMCFRCFPGRYAQIDLFAINKNFRQQGKGSLVIKSFKRLLQIRKIHLIVTHADNNSVQFYQKQGFSQNQYIMNEIWMEKKESFSFSTNMQCLVLPNTNYFILKQKIQRQRNNLAIQLKQYYFNQNQYQAIIPKQNKSFYYQQSKQTQHFLINPLELNGLYDNGWSWPQYKRLKQTKENQDYRSFVNNFINIYQTAVPQLKKISKNIVQSKNIIYDEPIDLQRLVQNIKSRGYQNQHQFWDQFSTFLKNASRLYQNNTQILQNLRILQSQMPRGKRQSV